MKIREVLSLIWLPALMLLILFSIAIVLAQGCAELSSDINERGLKGIVNEIWEGKK